MQPLLFPDFNRPTDNRQIRVPLYPVGSSSPVIELCDEPTVVRNEPIPWGEFVLVGLDVLTADGSPLPVSFPEDWPQHLQLFDGRLPTGSHTFPMGPDPELGPGSQLELVVGPTESSGHGQVALVAKRVHV